MDNLEDIAVFVKVVDAGSFTGAAEALETSQPVVSKSVTRLEQRLGVRLLNRTTRRISLTEAGTELYRKAASALTQLDEAQLDIGRYQSEPRGTLRLSAPTSFTLLHLPHRFAQFLERHPQVTLDLVLEDRVVDIVEEGFDAAIRVGVLSSSTLVARRLAPCKQVFCASPAYLERHGKPESVDDLLKHNCVVYTLGRDPRLWRVRAEDGTEVQLPVRGNAYVNSGLLEQALALEGLGLAMLPTFYVGDALREGRLVRVLEHVVLPEIGIYLVYADRRNLLPKLKALLDFLVESFGGEPDWERGLEL
ncbi:MAG TPA: LysR family transcriptional regulator [Gammaproteobacteria bacterium]|nr:LysR family transcriptional regulator [Gammaproteobacteria bacterium]